mmetsp:Transcript_40312/g.45874  ORF Transcript_40312/g.45874 Transcript_40312/m.45874 type:complete len:680 (-) Transcript_40312:168-2207(-)
MERSQRLVRECPIWSTLNDSKENRAIFKSQVPVSLSANEEHLYVVSLRSCFVENGHATPFKQVLSWLTQSYDFSTAASIGLGLLRDTESLNALKQLGGLDCSAQESYNIVTKGLLDGIIHLYPKGSLSLRPRESIISEVANMTIVCLAKGGLPLATVLDFFLMRNQEYDHAKACLVLVSIATRCVSRDKDVVENAMGSGYEYSNKSPPEELLWALRSLLHIGVARDYLAQVILLLNVAMPDELRCRKDEKLTTVPSMHFCKAIVSTILTSSQGAAPLVLRLVDEGSQRGYWYSLLHSVTLEFSLICVADSYPFLRQPEVRDWAMECLNDGVRQGQYLKTVNLSEALPTNWLQHLFEACLSNGGCDYGRLLASEIDEFELDSDDEGVNKYLSEIHMTMKALTAISKSNGLDFELMIPTLLILKQRDSLWNNGSFISTQRMLDTVCHLASRPETISSAFNGAIVMQQCAATTNVSAGANLVGGRNGLVLNCCDVLIQEAGIDMEVAELYILSRDLSDAIVFKRKEKLKGQDTENFSITEGHKKTLWLLSEHLLSIRTFGEFDPSHHRGKVDPVFAAQSCLRTWLLLSISENSTAWLVNWLSNQLGVTKEKKSQRRLSCAALTRALSWPTSDKSEELLSETMGMESAFLIQLAKSCQGLIESVPTHLGETIISHADSTIGKQ